LLPQRAGVRARTLEGNPGGSLLSVSSSSSAAAAVVAAISARARSTRGWVASPEPRGSSSRAHSSDPLSSERERQGTHSVHLFESQGSRQQQQQEEETPPLSILSQSAQSENTTSGGSTTMRTVTLAQGMSEASSQAQTWAHTPAGGPIPSSPSPPPQSSPHPPGDLNTAPTSFVTAPPTIVSRTTDSGGDGHVPEIWNEGAEHYAPPHTRGFMLYGFYVHCSGSLAGAWY